MQGRKLNVTPELERRILAAISVEDRASNETLSKRFGMSRRAFERIINATRPKTGTEQAGLSDS